MWNAEHELARLLWANEPAEGETISLRYGDEHLLLAVVVPAFQPEKWLWLRKTCHCRWQPAFNNTADHVIPGVLYGINPVGQPLWYMKNHLARYLFDIPHAV